MRPVVCFITDRTRFGAAWQDAMVAQVAAAAYAGVALIQVRERDLDARPLTALVTRCVGATLNTRTRIVVNERLDVALAAGAHGVHLRGDSMAAARVRPLVPPSFLIGRSVHSRDEAVRAGSDGALDYLLFGTVFPTGSKPGAAAAGADGLAGVAAASPLPVLGVGGMTPATLAGLARTGAAGFAAIGLFAAPAPDQLQMMVQQASAAFDTPGTVP